MHLKCGINLQTLLVQRYHQVTSNAPSVETREQVAEQGQEVEREAEVSDCAIEGEGQC